jgi:para-nitrobenzyl esterase
MGPIVETRQGKVEGFEEEGLRIFLGIPFARPPLGRLRFRAPEPPEPWRGMRDATRYGPSAPQAALELEEFMPGFDVGPQSEDCLYLNVFTPGPGGALRPVMVWLHGGAYTLGSGSQRMYDFRRLARDGDVVIVTINYRLGALAFLHLAGLDPALDTTACAGTLDQVAALEWVRDNAESFGGDPGCVTIFGESAGGMSVGTLLGTPSARGLFHRAIPQSGAAHRVNDPEAATRVASAFLEALGVTESELEAVWSAPVDAILKAQQQVEWGTGTPSHERPFCPAVEGRALPQPPIDAIRGGLSAAVPVMVGTCRDEEKLFSLWDPASRQLDEAGLVKRIDAVLPGQGARLVDAYRGARTARDADVSPFEIYSAIETDHIFRIPAVRLAEAQAAHQPRTFAYIVTWEASAMHGKLGACHGIDLPFVQGAIGSKSAGIFAGSGPEAERLSSEMMGAWLAFARSGDPGHQGMPDWPAYEATRRATMLFGRESRAADAPFDAERRAWDGIL